MFYYFFSPPPKEQASILTIYSNLQKLETVLKRISYAELLSAVQVLRSTESKDTAQCAALVTSGLNRVGGRRNTMGGRERKCQRKRNFVPLLEGHKNVTEERRKQNNGGDLKKGNEKEKTVATDQKC